MADKQTLINLFTGNEDPVTEQDLILLAQQYITTTTSITGDINQSTDQAYSVELRDPLALDEFIDKHKLSQHELSNHEQTLPTVLTSEQIQARQLQMLVEAHERAVQRQKQQ